MRAGFSAFCTKNFVILPLDKWPQMWYNGRPGVDRAGPSLSIDKSIQKNLFQFVQFAYCNLFPVMLYCKYSKGRKRYLPMKIIAILLTLMLCGSFVYGLDGNKREWIAPTLELALWVAFLFMAF